MLPTQARASHTSPQGCFVHHWNVHVECCLWLHPIHTMHTGPIHEVPTYTHRPNRHFPHGWCTIYVPTIHPFHRHFVNFPAPRCCHACSESGHITAFGRSCPPCHPHPGVTPLQHRPQRPFFWEAGTLIGGPPPLSSYPRQRFAHVHTPTSISSQIALHLDPPVCPCHSSTRGSLAHHWPQRPSFQLVGAPIMCPPPPINLQQYSTLHPHPCTRSEPGCTATLGCACPSMFPIAWRNFHHKPALVAPFILWLEYLLCAHHTHFPIFQLPGTHVNLPFCQPGPFTACTPPCTPFCAPSHTPAHLCALPFQG